LPQAKRKLTKPRPNDTLIQWFKPLVVSALKAENIKSPAQLKAYAELRGDAWYRAAPRIGKVKAATLQRWLTHNRILSQRSPRRYSFGHQELLCSHRVLVLLSAPPLTSWSLLATSL
jgi:hypothetical protein